MEGETAAIVNATFRSVMAVTSFQNGSDVRWCPNDEPGDAFYKEFYETAQVITGLIIYPTAIFFGLVGNALTIFVLSRRNMRTSTNAFLGALAVSDSIKLINDMLYIFVTVLFRTSSNLGNLAYGYLYPYAHFIFTMSVCVSSWLTVSVAVERYILVCHPTRARALWNRKRAVILCTFIYIIMTSLALPSAFRYRTIRCIDAKTNMSMLEVELTEIWQNDVMSTGYHWAQNLLRSIIPLFVLVVLNACIISALRRTKAKRRKNSRHRVTIMMLVVILVFLVCITPDAIMSMVFRLGYHEAGYLGKGFREITDSLLTINAGVNFIIYCACNQVFRKSFAGLCFPKKQTTNWMTELDESTYRRYSESKSLLSSNNNSPPRQDTPPTAMTDSSKTKNKNTGGVNNSTSKNEAVNQWMKSYNTDHTRQSMSSLTSVSSSTDSHNNHQQHHQHHRVSSSGLKKCRNSIKTNRAKKKSCVTFRDYADDGMAPVTHFEDTTDLDNEDTSNTRLSPLRSSCNTDIDNCTEPVEKSLQIPPDSSMNFSAEIEKPTQNEELVVEMNDTQQLEKFRDCDGSQILISSKRDSNSELLNAENSEGNICLKEGANSINKRCNFSALFMNPADNVKGSTFSPGERNVDICDVSYSKGDKCAHIALGNRGCNQVTTNSPNAEIINTGATRDSDYVMNSFTNGVILTTDL